MSAIIETVHGKMMDSPEVDFCGCKDFGSLVALKKGLVQCLNEAMRNPDMPQWPGQTRYGMEMMNNLVDNIQDYITDRLVERMHELEDYAGLVHNGFADPYEE